MRAVTFRIARGPENEGCDTYHGFVVEDTEDLFVVDERYPAEPAFGEEAIFAITHLPSGRRLRNGPFTRAATKEQAIHIAQGFYREAKALGMNLEATDLDTISHGYLHLSEKKQVEFWQRVRDGIPT